MIHEFADLAEARAFIDLHGGWLLDLGAGPVVDHRGRSVTSTDHVYAVCTDRSDLDGLRDEDQIAALDGIWDETADAFEPVGPRP